MLNRCYWFISFSNFSNTSAVTSHLVGGFLGSNFSFNPATIQTTSIPKTISIFILSSPTNYLLILLYFYITVLSTMIIVFMNNRLYFEFFFILVISVSCNSYHPHQFCICKRTAKINRVFQNNLLCILRFFCFKCITLLCSNSPPF